MKGSKPKVLILGSCHMSEHEELLSDKRQAEIRELVFIVQKFEPTKIAVESITDKQNKLNEDFKQYKLGVYELALHEIDQIGFRMAANLKHKQVYAIDWMGGNDVTDVWDVHKWGKKINQIYLKKYLLWYQK